MRWSVPRTTLLPLLVAGAYFMENLDGTVIVTAMPQIAASFGVQPVDLSIGVSAYMLTLAVLIPASGWVADRFGPRRVFAGALLVFTLASILCGLSQNLLAFTAARILQGAAGAMMVPVGRLVVLRNTPKEGLMRAIATIVWPGLAAPVLGPPLGGFIATHATWNWIFFLNVPLGIIGMLAAIVLIPKGQGEAGRPFDLYGFVLTSLACLGLMSAVELISHSGSSWIQATIVLLVSGGLAMLALRHAKHHPHPLIDLWALRVRSFALTIHGGTLFAIAVGAVPFLLPLMFQLSFGLDAFHAGLLVLAVFAGNIVMKPLTTPVLRRFSFRTTMLAAGSINVVTILACGFLQPGTPTFVVAGVLFLSGMARSMQFTSFYTLAFAEVPPERMNGANTLFNTSQQMAIGIGIAMGAVALHLASVVNPGGSANAIPLLNFRIAFGVIALIALADVLDVRGLSRTAGDHVRLGRRTA
jgi:EmrB/QacA subfamily drug resistance transporter